MGSNTISFPNTPPLLGIPNLWNPEWVLWLTNPSFSSVTVPGAIPTTSGGTGIAGTPPTGTILVGTGSAFAFATTLPATAFPALTGDITTSAGSLATTLATVNGSPGAYGSGTAVATYTVNAKGLITVSGSASITGAPGSFTVVTAFGCNGKTAQTSAAVNAAIAGAAGAAYTGVEQGLINSLLALVNQLRAALVANGIAV